MKLIFLLPLLLWGCGPTYEHKCIEGQMMFKRTTDHMWKGYGRGGVACYPSETK